MPEYGFVVYLAVCAGVTYLIRMLPLVLVRKKIKNRFVLSFLYYIPFAVLTVMTVPACFYATGNIWSAIAGVAVALFVAWKGKGLPVVAACACVGALAVEVLCRYVLV